MKFYLGIRCLVESLPLLKDKLHHKPVLKGLQSIIEQAKKKLNTKTASIELEEKIEELLKCTEETNQSDSAIMPPPPVPPKMRKRTRRTKRRSSSDEEDENADSDSDATPTMRSTLLFI